MNKADRAKELLNNPVFKEAISEVRQYWLDRVEMLPLDEAQGGDALYDIRKMLFLLRQVEETIERYVEDGHLEDFNQNEKQRTILGDLWNRK